MKPQSFILSTISPYVFVAINILAFYLLLKGHNEPGGGFIAGVASAISLVFLSMTLRLDDLKQIIKFEPTTLAVCGLILAYGTSLVPTFFGFPFLFHKMVHLHLPLWGNVHVGTPLLFDVGVYLVVVGVTSKLIITFSYSIEQRVEYVHDEKGELSRKDAIPVDERSSKEEK